MSRKDDLARDFQRRLLSLSRTVGVLCFEQGTLKLLVRPTARPANPEELLELCEDPVQPSARELMSCLGASEVLEIDAGRIAKWVHGLQELTRTSTLFDLVEEGVRPLRRYRDTDLRAQLDDYLTRIDRYKRLLSLVPVAQTCLSTDEPDLGTLVQIFPLCVDTLGPWDNVLEILSRPSVAAQPHLLRLLRHTNQPNVAMLCATLLGRRVGNRSEYERLSAQAEIPGEYQDAFLAGTLDRTTPLLLHSQLLHGGKVVPPGLHIAPAALQEKLCRLASRCLLLYGVSATSSVMNNVVRPYEPATDQFEFRRDRVLHLLTAMDRGKRVQPLSTDEEELVQHLRRLRTAQGNPRDAVELFLHWVDPEQIERVIGFRPLMRIAVAGWPRGLRHTLTTLLRAWSEKRLERIQKAHESLHVDTAMRTLFSLTLIDVELILPAKVRNWNLIDLRDWLQKCSSERALEVMAVLGNSLEGWLSSNWEKLIVSDLPISLIKSIKNLDLVADIDVLLTRPRELEQFVQTIEELQQHGYNDLQELHESIAELFARGSSHIPAVVLTLLRRKQKQSKDNLPTALLALARDLRATGPLSQHARDLSLALEEWNNTTRTPLPDDLASLPGLLGVSQAELQCYLHYRKLCGEPAGLAHNLLDPLHLTQREQTEAAFLEQRIQSMPSDAPGQLHLQIRLDRLRDPVACANRLKQATERAKHRLLRSLEVYRGESLEHVLDRVYAQYAGRLLNRPIEVRRLPKGFREAMALLHAPRIDRVLLLSFLDDVLTGRSLLQREPNLKWLERARESGIHTNHWLAGFHTTLKINDIEIKCATEHDPLHVLRMGDYFSTCLNLEEGFNAASTLVNALDVNKQVIYGRRADGTVVMRKLIGATLNKALAGYQTYASENKELVQQALSEALQTYAQQCGLTLSNSATPEILHPGFWYDDGNEAWLSVQTQPEPLPADIPKDPSAVAEWHFTQALLTNDWTRLARVVGPNMDGWREGAFYHLVKECPDQWKSLLPLDPEPDHWQVLAFLQIAGKHEAILSEQWERDRFLPTRWRAILDYPTCSTVKPERRFVELRQLIRRPPHPQNEHCGVSVTPTLHGPIPVSEILGFMEDLTPGSCSDCKQNPRSLEDWASFLQFNGWHSSDHSALIKGVTGRDKWVRSVVLKLAQREPISGMASVLRRLVSASRGVDSDLALALGTQGNAGDGPTLLEVFRRSPSAKTAVAVCRTGNEACVEEVRSLWIPEGQPWNAEPNGSWSREIGGVRLVRAFRKHLRENLASQEFQHLSDEARGAFLVQLTRRISWLAQLGIPGPEGNPEVILPDLAPYDSTLRPWIMATFPDCYDLWKLMVELPRQSQRLARAGEQALSALDWWQEVQQRVYKLSGISLTDPRIDPHLLRLALLGSADLRSSAMLAWGRNEIGRRFLGMGALQYWPVELSTAVKHHLVGVLIQEWCRACSEMGYHAALGATLILLKDLADHLDEETAQTLRRELKTTTARQGAVYAIIVCLLMCETEEHPLIRPAKWLLGQVVQLEMNWFNEIIDQAYHWLPPARGEAIISELAEIVKRANLCPETTLFPRFISRSGSYHAERWVLQHFGRSWISRKMQSQWNGHAERSEWWCGIMDEHPPDNQ